ncbi:hypothetical protein SOP93_16985 [Peribacillus frigoritolerans]|nr:hypothetical protein [Peribacillus frigoritolerans]MEB2492862.1 hypothetical protein [Peribacillus frigoritolerans]
MSKSLTIDDMRNIASEKGGWCLSEEYKNQLTKLTWKCSNGHVWETLPKHIRKGAWCPICSRKKENRNFHKNVTIELLKQKAEEKEGKCLSNKYINQITKLPFKCKEGHIFESTPSSILRGTWCPYCAGKHKYSIEKMHKIAKNYGGKCLSSNYTNVFTKLKWSCSNGHEFEAIPKHVINGHWCPNCTIYINEERCRYILEQLFDAKFIKTRNILGDNYELDGYNEELKIAFEFQGKQHYEHIDFFYSRMNQSVEERIKVDQIKVDRCKDLRIDLLVIPYTVEPNEQVNFISRELQKLGHKFKVDPNSISFDNHEITQHSLKEIKDFAISKGGKCLSNVYINVDTKLNFICEKGHHFTKTPYNFNKGQWCRTCSYEKRGDLYRLNVNEMNLVAEEKGWKCLSIEYINAREKLLWECENGHIFERTLAHVKEGRGCPTCNKRKR